jgi:hypothetical protein
LLGLAASLCGSFVNGLVSRTPADFLTSAMISRIPHARRERRTHLRCLCLALALAEAASRLSDRADPVPDEVWNAAARHYNEMELSALVSIGLINLTNRLNAVTTQVGGDWIVQYV